MAIAPIPVRNLKAGVSIPNPMATPGFGVGLAIRGPSEPAEGRSRGGTGIDEDDDGSKIILGGKELSEQEMETLFEVGQFTHLPEWEEMIRLHVPELRAELKGRRKNRSRAPSSQRLPSYRMASTHSLNMSVSQRGVTTSRQGGRGSPPFGVQQVGRNSPPFGAQQAGRNSPPFGAQNARSRSPPLPVGVG